MNNKNRVQSFGAQYRGQSDQTQQIRNDLRKYFGQNYEDSILGINDKNYIDVMNNLNDFVENKMRPPAVTSSQLRNLFNHVKKNEKDEDTLIGLFKLKPLLAYAIGRAKNKKQFEVFATLIEDLLPKLNKENKKNFVEFFEAIVAYHKRIHGGD